MRMKQALQEKFQEKMERRLNELNAHITELKANVDRAEAEVRIKLHEQLQKLKAKQEEANKKLEEWKGAGGERWEQLKTGTERVLDELKNTFDRVVAFYSRKGIPNYVGRNFLIYSEGGDKTEKRLAGSGHKIAGELRNTFEKVVAFCSGIKFPARFGKTLLVCSDKCDEIEECLLASGCKVVKVSDGRMAVSLARRDIFDAAVLVSTGNAMDVTETAFNLRDIRVSMPIIVVAGRGGIDRSAGAPEIVAQFDKNTRVVTTQQVQNFLKTLRKAEK